MCVTVTLPRITAEMKFYTSADKETELVVADSGEMFVLCSSYHFPEYLVKVERYLTEKVGKHFLYNEDSRNAVKTMVKELPTMSPSWEGTLSMWVR
jgi:hypothetical protein